MNPRCRTIGRLLVALVAVPWVTTDTSNGQIDLALPLTRLSEPIEFDGSPDEPAWREVPALPLTMYYPTFGGMPEQRTEIRIAYDDRYLYAGGWFYDDDPEGIRINSLYRDRWNGDDAFAIYVDAFNDNQNSKWFGTTPAGMRFDLLVSDDGATLNGSWNAFWDARTTVTPEGWFAEVRIPFSTLGFQTGPDGLSTMGITVTRLVSRTGERVVFPSIDPKFLFRQPSVSQDVSLSNVRTRTPIYLSPYVLGGRGRQSTADASTTSSLRDIGVDLKYALSGNLTLDVTANTDFAQVEADDQQINLDRFSLFFPEKRRFFQEASGLFDFSLGGGSRLFHSRRIGLTAGNESVPVLGGARLVGRVGQWDVGLLDMQTDKLGDTTSENFGVVRLRRTVLNPNSFAGGMFTSRVRPDGHSVAGGLDATLRMFGDTYLTMKWSGSSRSDAPDSGSLASSSHVQARWQRRASRGLGYSIEASRAGADYLPELGFVRRTDFSQVNLLANYYIFTDDPPRFRRVWPGALAFSTFRNHDGTLESGQYAVWVQWETKGGGGGWIEPKLFVEDVLTPFRIGGAVDVPAGRHTYADLQLVLAMPNGRRLRTRVDARAGSFFDGTRAQVIARPTWNVSPHLELGADYQWSRLRFSSRDQETDIQLVRLRVRTALNSRASGNAFVQYNSTTDKVDVNVRLRYNFSEGRDLWIVYNEGLAADRMPNPAEARLPLSLSRTVLLKYTHTFGG